MIFKHISNSFYLLFCVGLWLTVLVGWGSLMKRLFGNPLHKKLQFSDAWLGLVVVIAFTETYHLWLAIDWKLSLLVIMIGITSVRPALSEAAETCNWRTTLRKLDPIVVLVACFLLFTWTALALTTPSIYDGGLYYFQAIRWLNEFPIVVGLGNLSGRLAFNQSYFSYLALLNIAPFFDKGYSVGGLLLIVMTSLTLIEAKLIKICGGWWLNLWIMIALITISRYLSSPSPDVAVVLIQSVVFIFLIKIYSPSTPDQADAVYSAVMVFFLCCLLVTIKLSAVMFATVAILLVLPSIKATHLKYKKLYLYAFIIGSYFVTVHLIRGFLLSGLPLYPSTLGAMHNPDWSVPADQAKEMANWIYSWARDGSKMPDEVLSSWAWLPLWTEQLLKERWRYIYGALLFTGLDAIALFAFKKTFSEKRVFALFTPFVAAIVFWFFTAPDWRFLGAIPQLVIALSGWIFIQSYMPRSILSYTEKLPSFIPSAFVGLLIMILMTKIADFKTLPLVGWHAIPTVDVRAQATSNGLILLVPETGDQCWNSPLPCAPKFNNQLHLRNEDSNLQDLGGGFRIQR